MIAILTDKPSVGKEIGRIIGATKIKKRICGGNGYMVTWTFGNMLSLAMPKDYGTQKLERDDFPFIPARFGLMIRHTRTENGWIPDIEAVLQLKVIEKVFQNCDTIIAATDASRGEMAFRYVYQYLNCTQPCSRLWISSLTDRSVRKGLGGHEAGQLLRQPVPLRRLPQQGGLDSRNQRQLCHVQGDGTRQQFPRTGADTGAGSHKQTLPGKGEPYFI